MTVHIGINLCPYTGGFGGAETYMKNLVAAMARIRCPHRVSLFIAAGMEGHFSASTGFKEIVCGRVGQSRTRRVFLEQTLLPKLIDRYSIDVIFSNYVSPVRARCRQIVNVHDMLYKVHPNYIPGRTKLWYWSAMVPASIRRAETVLTVSRHSAHDIRRFFPADAHKVVVGSQAVSYELASMDSPDLDADLIRKMGVTEPFVLCTAGLDRHKNIGSLLQGFGAAVRHHHQLSLVVTDPYHRRHTDALDGTNGPLKSRVILAGCVPPRQLAALYRRAIAHVTTSRFEGFGRSVIEAQSFGCPNITSLAASLPEIAGDAALYFHPDDSATLATHLEALLQDQSRRQDLIAQGYKNVQRFNWETIARQFLDLCDPVRRVGTPFLRSKGGGQTRNHQSARGNRSHRFSHPKRAAGFNPRGAPRRLKPAARDWSKNGRVKELPLLILMPHSRCNCRCVMCDIWKSSANRRELSVEQISTWRSTFRKMKVQRVMLTGGEPLMHGNINRLLRLLHACGLRTTLLSSGLLLRRHARVIVDYCTDVVVSLDGGREVHDVVRRVPDAFEKLADGVRALHRLDLSFRVTGRCTIQRGNFRDWLNMVDAAREIGLASISFQAADVTTTAFNHPQGWDLGQVESVAVPRSELPELMDMVEKVMRTCAMEIETGFIAESPRKLRRIFDHFAALCGESEHVAPRCNVPWVSAVIEADGSVRPCFFHRSFGNVNDLPLTDILNSEDMVKFRKTLSVADDPICQRCVCSLYLPSKRFSLASGSERSAVNGL